MKEYQSNPYLALFYGEQIYKSEIEARAPYTLPAINTLLNDEKLLGQYTLEGDLLLWMLKPRNALRGRERLALALVN